MFPVSGYQGCTLGEYIDAGRQISEDFNNGNISAIVDGMNDAFFGGGVLAPKSINYLFTLSDPKAPHFLWLDRLNRNSRSSYFQVENSNYSYLAISEGVPFIGSAIATMNATLHLFMMWRSYQYLHNAVEAFGTVEHRDENLHDSWQYTEYVVNAARDYTLHRNYLMGSLLSIIPFAKPTVRVLQGILYIEPIPQFQRA
ncbi:MAG: hypothetical protein KAR79_01465 [Simkaniaceae bacterium]|nr:hypothetical protein [Simkaniaceae bacterium]